MESCDSSQLEIEKLNNEEKNKFDDFKKAARKIAEEFRKVENKKPIRITSHLDADGISAASILIRALQRENLQYCLSIVQQLDDEFLYKLAAEGSDVYFFTDLGSSFVPRFNSIFNGKKVFVLDHHSLDAEGQGAASSPENRIFRDKSQAVNNACNVHHLNPHLFGIDGSKEISGAGVVYFFAKSLNRLNKDMAHAAIIGAIGDVQEDGCFRQLNNEILEDAVAAGKMEVRKGLRIFGIQTKPLHIVLTYSSNPVIPGLYGDESKAIQFLIQNGINPKLGNGWVRYSQLSLRELKKLISAVIIKVASEGNTDEILGNNYLVCGEPDHWPTRDVREFATLLNACGRMGKASLGVGACLDDLGIKKKAIASRIEYRQEITRAMTWFKDNKESKNILSGRNYLIINAGDNVIPQMIGTISSIISKSNMVKDDTFIMGIARDKRKKSKVSLRIAGMQPDGNVNLNHAIKHISEGIECEEGGHKFAAGALIASSDEKRFIAQALLFFAKAQSL